LIDILFDSFIFSIFLKNKKIGSSHVLQSERKQERDYLKQGAVSIVYINFVGNICIREFFISIILDHFLRAEQNNLVGND